MLKNYLDLKQILWKTILKSFFGKIKTCGKISWKSKCKSQRAENCLDILWIVMQTPVPKFYTLVPNWKKVRNTQELSPSAQWISVKGNMKHSETFTLRKTKVIFFQMEAWNIHKLSLRKWNIFKWKHETLRTSNPQKNGHEQFSYGNVMNFDLQKNENENSHPQMHAVCRSGEKNMTNQQFEEFQETGCRYVLFQCLMLCVAHEKANLCQSQ